MSTHDRKTATTTVTDPSPSDAREAAADGLARGAVVTIVGDCSVTYDGRASSRLDPGGRLVVVKPDGTVLVHSTTGQQPVNWQPPGCEQQLTVQDGELILESHRTTPSERLVVRFHHVLQVAVYELADSESLSLRGTEADLRDRVLEEPDCIEPGFTPLATERETSAGAIDIFGEDAAGRAVVVELKRRRVGPDAVSQLRRYVDALGRDLHADAAVRGILVAPSTTDRAQCLLDEHGLGFVSLDPTSG